MHVLSDYFVFHLNNAVVVIVAARPRIVGAFFQSERCVISSDINAALILHGIVVGFRKTRRYFFARILFVLYHRNGNFSFFYRKFTACFAALIVRRFRNRYCKSVSSRICRSFRIAVTVALIEVGYRAAAVVARDNGIARRISVRPVCDGHADGYLRFGYFKRILRYSICDKYVIFVCRCSHVINACVRHRRISAYFDVAVHDFYGNVVNACRAEYKLCYLRRVVRSRRTVNRRLICACFRQRDLFCDYRKRKLSSCACLEFIIVTVFERYGYRRAGACVYHAFWADGDICRSVVRQTVCEYCRLYFCLCILCRLVFSSSVVAAYRYFGFSDRELYCTVRKSIICVCRRYRRGRGIILSCRGLRSAYREGNVVAVDNAFCYLCRRSLFASVISERGFSPDDCQLFSRNFKRFLYRRSAVCERIV